LEGDIRCFNLSKVGRPSGDEGQGLGEARLRGWGPAPGREERLEKGREGFKGMGGVPRLQEVVGSEERDVEIHEHIVDTELFIDVGR